MRYFSTLEKEKKVSDGKVKGRKKREGERGREREGEYLCHINSIVAVYIE